MLPSNNWIAPKSLPLIGRIGVPLNVSATVFPLRSAVATARDDAFNPLIALDAPSPAPRSSASKLPYLTKSLMCPGSLSTISALATSSILEPSSASAIIIRRCSNL